MYALKYPAGSLPCASYGVGWTFLIYSSCQMKFEAQLIRTDLMVIIMTANFTAKIQMESAKLVCLTVCKNFQRCPAVHYLP